MKITKELLEKKAVVSVIPELEEKQPKERKNSEETITKIINLWKNACTDEKRLQRAFIEGVTISAGNDKIGKTLNVSLLPVVTCGATGKHCMEYCYAVRVAVRLGLERAGYINSNVYLNNTLIAVNDIDFFFECINAAVEIEKPDFFRWHVSGEIINSRYLKKMVETACLFPNTVFYTYTKKYQLVNDYIDNNGNLPDNLVIVFSDCYGLKMINKHGLPVCYINYADNAKNERLLKAIAATKAAEKKIFKCGGDCKWCQINGVGCPHSRRGDIIIINQH